MIKPLFLAIQYQQETFLRLAFLLGDDCPLSDCLKSTVNNVDKQGRSSLHKLVAGFGELGRFVSFNG